MATLENLKQQIITSINKLTTLETVTIVGGISYDDDNNVWKWSGSGGTEAMGMLTQKRLIDGDITTVIHPDILRGDLSSLREYHAEREKAGMEMVEKNIAAVKSLFDLVIDLASHEKSEGGTEHLDQG